MQQPTAVERLLDASEPSVRYLYRRDVLGEDPASESMLTLQEEIRTSVRVQKMLDARDKDGKFPWHAYTKWIGAFWTLLVLSDIGYPAGDQSLVPLRDQVLEWLFSEKHQKHVRLINGRWRRCACQESSIVLTMLKLGLVDDRISVIVENLIKWQWPDGGWNCDKNPSASHSSFHETWLPLRAIKTYADATGSSCAAESVEKASEVFLSHRLYKKKGEDIVLDMFTRQAFPAYWHYDFLVGLRVMGEVGRLDDPRCHDALDLLESKRLPDGGFPAAVKYYRVTQQKTEGSGISYVGWGGVKSNTMNEWVTVMALSVLKKSGRSVH
jgi:hypothetical protein